MAKPEFTTPAHSRPRRTVARAALTACALMLAFGGQAQAAPGDLDSSFSFDGRQTTDFGGNVDFGRAVAVQADGKTVVAGRTSAQGDGAGDDFALARYNPDGTLDSSFSGDGKQTTDFNSSNDRGEAVAVQADGKIVVAGRGGNASGTDFALARYSPDGTIDSSFSGDGKQTTNFGTTPPPSENPATRPDPIDSYDRGEAVALQADGQIVVVGSSDQGSNDDFALARYKPDGTLDSSFSGDGKHTTDFGDKYEEGKGVALQADGKILAAGRFLQDGGRGYSFALARYNPDGTLDSSFSGDGKQTTDFALGEAVAVQADGKIVVVGTAGGLRAEGGDFALARYNPDGTLDSSFSGDGKQTTDFAGSGDGGVAVALQTDAKIVVAGLANSSDFALARYRADGTLDSSFSGDGKQTTDFAANGSTTYVAAVAVQADGNIVVAGEFTHGLTVDFALARYEGGSDPPDITPPDTTITSGPTGTTTDAMPAFGFSSSEAGSSFECRVDTGAFAPCSSPHTTAELGYGQHTFEVRATDQAGNTDQTPASRSFTVSRVVELSSSFLLGVHSVNHIGRDLMGGEPDEAAADAAYLGARAARLGGFPGSATVADILPSKQQFDAKGIEIILVAEADGAGPTDAEARNLATWARAFGPGGPHAGDLPLRQIEFGNENSYTFPGKAGPEGGTDYANNYRIAYDAINDPARGNPEVGLLAQADGDHPDRRAEWIRRMFTAQPRLAAMVADNGGWVVHPYGPAWKQRLDQIVSQPRLRDAPSVPIFLTEWGLVNTRDGRRMNPSGVGLANNGWEDVPGSGGACMKYHDAARALRSTVPAMRNYSTNGFRIRRVFLYSQADLKGEPGEAPEEAVTYTANQYFGALRARWWMFSTSQDLQSGRRDKGLYTQEVKAQMRSATLVGALPASTAGPACYRAQPKPPPPPPPPGGGCPPGSSAGVRCQPLPGGGRRITGTAGNDRIVGTNASDSIRCGDGDDVVSGGGGNDTISCGDGRDRISGNAGNDRIFGEAGNDRLSGDLGNDSLSGGTGNDRGSGAGGRDRINGERGDDILSGNSNNDSISGSTGRDRISGDSGNDRISGGSGRDRLSGASGNDSISARDRQRDSVNCSRGRDHVSADRIDQVSRTCERVRRR